MKKLDPIVIELEKTTLIEASAGTGKTYTIATLVLRLVAKGYCLESILVVTFTEAAAAELKLRIRTRLLDTLKRLEGSGSDSDDDLVLFFNSQNDKSLICKRLTLALTSFDQAAVMTIHSFCYKVLKEHSFESGTFFDIELVPDRSGFLKQVSYDFFMGHVNDLDPLFLSYLNQQQITPENIVVSFSKALSRPDLVCLPPHAQYIDFFDDYRQMVKQIQTMLDENPDALIQLLADCKGLDKRSYSKKNVPAWLSATKNKIARTGVNTLFKMEEKGDAIYKFTQRRLNTKVKSGPPLSHSFFDCCEQLLGLSQQFTVNLISLKLKFIEFFRQALNEMKQTQGICFFDDLVNDLAAALETQNGHDTSKNIDVTETSSGQSDPLNLLNQSNMGGQELKHAVRKTYKACLIDEFQDTDPRQYDIFATLFLKKGSPFFMIGDPKQAIYAFRGGDIFAYLKASKQCDQRFTLEKNYRSAPLLVNGVNQVFLNQENPFSFKGIEFTPVLTPPTACDRLIEKQSTIPPLRFCFLKRDDSDLGIDLDRQGYISKETAKRLIPRIVAKDILTLLQSKKKLIDETDSTPKQVNPEDIAVLVRTNGQAELVQKALSTLQIPSFLSKTGSVFDSVQAIELYDILCAVYEPDNTALIRAALCTSVFNFTAKKIEELDTDEITYHLWHTFFSDFKKEWETKDFVSMIMALLHSEQAFLKGKSAMDERGVTNFYHLVEIISQACLKQQLSAYFLTKWFAKQLDPQLRDESPDKLSGELRLESDKKAIAIVTIHKSKGMEYPIVYLPYLWEGQHTGPRTDILFHDPDKEDCLTLDLGSDQIETARDYFEKEDMAEQRRLLYVAMTRASALCKIVWAGFKTIDTSSLGSLLHPGGCKEDKLMLDDLEHFQSANPLSICFETKQDELTTPFFKENSEPHPPETVRQMQHDVLPSWTISSFSALVHSTIDHSADSSYQGPDTKKSISDTSPTTPTAPIAPIAPIAPVIELETFPKGAGAGDFFHAVFENIDFTGTDEETFTQVNMQLNRHGFIDDTLGLLAQNSIKQVIGTELETQSGNAPQKFKLKNIPKSRRLNEMEFTFTVESLGIPKLIQALALSDQEFETKGYLNTLSRLNVSSITGYLKGFIDLIVQNEGRYYIIDYKSNYLGSTYDCYSSQQIQKAMADHHYYLQYHIYLLALHRYLSHRIKNYDYDIHIGGIFYLFIRGMHPDFGSKHGVFYDRPSKKLIHMLSDTL